jgi:uncharacterized integral membrane protein
MRPIEPDQTQQPPAPGGGQSEAGEGPAGDTAPPDPLRSSFTARAWVMLAALAFLLLALIIFVAQNTERVALRFLGWTWHPPLAVAILASIVGGLLLAVLSGTLRIWQLRRRVRRVDA